MDPSLPLFVHIPKSGGTTVKTAFKDRIKLTGHRPAWNVRKDFPKLWEEAPFKFSMVRDPWDRAISWYYYAGWPMAERPSRQHFPAPGTNKSREDFEEWLRRFGHCLFESWRHPAAMLLDENNTIMVDHVFQMEKMKEAMVGIAHHTTGRLPPVTHENSNEKRKKTVRHYSQLYTEWSRGFIHAASFFEINTFGYEYKNE